MTQAPAVLEPGTDADDAGGGTPAASATAISTQCRHPQCRVNGICQTPDLCMQPYRPSLWRALRSRKGGDGAESDARPNGGDIPGYPIKCHRPRCGMQSNGICDEGRNCPD